MVRSFIAGLALGVVTASATAAIADTSGQPNDGHSVYVQIIVKACPRVETPLVPINQGKSYDDEKPMTMEQRKAELAALGCIDVPVPMDWLNGEMTPEACRGHAGYLVAMQFLEQRQDLKNYPAVGGWGCLESDYQVVGAVNQ
jgi:hypothetical protein